MPDPFALLGLPPRFDLDQAELQQRFLAASSENHPDRFTDPLDQADAAERSAAINHAHQTLADPESRARALLALHGDADEADTDAALPPALLMEVMEIREEMEQAIAGDDHATLARLRTWAHEKRDEHVAELASRFAASPVDATTVRRVLNALRYVQRMLDQMPD
ncbi:MAG: Fe-S protein assembly co-chaperone HscB [Planctomycetota bacterium]